MQQKSNRKFLWLTHRIEISRWNISSKTNRQNQRSYSSFHMLSCYRHALHYRQQPRTSPGDLTISLSLVLNPSCFKLQAKQPYCFLVRTQIVKHQFISAMLGCGSQSAQSNSNKNTSRNGTQISKEMHNSTLNILHTLKSKLRHPIWSVQEPNQ